MSAQQILQTDEIFRARVESLGAVDDLVVTIVASLQGIFCLFFSHK